MTEKVLPYDRGTVPQETGYWCGPASAQVVLNSRGIKVREAQLAREIGTTWNGTDFVGLIERVLDARVPDAQYTSVYMPNDPPTAAQKDRLWGHLTASIDAGWGVIANIVAPVGNHPRAVSPSTVSPNYGNSTIWHYIPIMGYSDDGPRRAWVADTGFSPFGYWLSFDQLTSLIPPKGYAYAAASAAPSEEDDMTPEQAQQLRDVHRELTQRYPSRSKYRKDDKPVDTMAGLVLNADGRAHEASVDVPARMDELDARLDRLEKLLVGLPQKFADAIEGGPDA